MIPPARTATRSGAAVARAWATAANSSTYRDAGPGEWTERARPFVTGAEARSEAAQRHGQGGSTWAQIQAGRCATSLRGLTAAVPSDAPRGPASQVVYVAATAVLSCATGDVQLTPFAAQLIVQRVADRWLVARVSH